MTGAPVSTKKCMPDALSLTDIRIYDRWCRSAAAA